MSFHFLTNVIHERHDALVLNAQIGHRLLALHLRAIVLPEVGAVLHELTLRAEVDEDEPLKRNDLNANQTHGPPEALPHRGSADTSLAGAGIEEGACRRLHRAAGKLVHCQTTKHGEDGEDHRKSRSVAKE